jgi:uncharacterized protein (DUF427 family)
MAPESSQGRKQDGSSGGTAAFTGGLYNTCLTSPLLKLDSKGDQNMNEKQVKLPGPDHAISIERNHARVVVSVASCVIADTRNALTLREAAYPLVQYIPGEDVDFSQLERTDHVTYCPYKGDCNYYSVPAGGKKSVNAAWSYGDPFPAVEQIKGYVAFYPERVDAIAEQLPI